MTTYEEEFADLPYEVQRSLMMKVTERECEECGHVGSYVVHSGHNSYPNCNNCHENTIKVIG